MTVDKREPRSCAKVLLIRELEANLVAYTWPFSRRPMSSVLREALI